MENVHFLPAGKMGKSGSMDKLLEPFTGCGNLDPTDLMAVKIHPGEEGNSSHLKPGEVTEVISALHPGTSRIFLTDTTVLYPGKRMNAPDYLVLAAKHGFTPPDTPPFVVADGLRGYDELEVPLPGRDGRTAHVASLIAEVDALVVISHFKGHLLAGFGGAVKNLGMGCASKAGKLIQHSSVKPVISENRCTGCGICAAHCRADAISVRKTARIDADSCTGCGECLDRCPTGAVRVSWNRNMNAFMTRLAEHAWAAASVSRPVLFVNFVTRIVPNCDCMADTDPPLVDDVGILASIDPVALDKASLDLVTAAPPSGNSPVRAGAGEDKFRAFRPDIDGELQLRLAESMGLGSRNYRLAEVSH